MADLGIHYPVGQIDVSAHHEIPNLVKKLDKRLKIMNKQFNSSIEVIFTEYLRNMSESGLSHLWLSSEDFATFKLEDYLWLVNFLNNHDFDDIKFVAYSFDPNQRIDSHVDQLVRQGEFVDEIARSAILDYATEISNELKSLSDRLHGHGVEMELLDYEEEKRNRNLVVSFLLAMGLNSEQTDSAIKAKDILEDYNLSLHPEERYMLNVFNGVNNGGRKFNGECPIIFSEDFLPERARFIEMNKAIEKLTEFRKINTGLLAKNEVLESETIMLKGKLTAIENSTIWRITKVYRLLRNKTRLVFKGPI